MSESNLKKRYIRFVSQNILGMLGISCYILADTFFISVAAGADGITVLNLCLPIYNLIFAFGSMIGVGSATRFAIRSSALRQAEASIPEHSPSKSSASFYFSNAIVWVIISSIPFSACGIFFPGTVLTLMGADAAIAALGIPYARICMSLAPCFMLNYVIGAFVRNDNDPTLAMAGTIFSSLFNILFDYILMFPCGMGLAGAALATALSPLVSIGICSFHFAKPSNTIHFSLRRPSFRLLITSCELGTSAFIGELSSGVTTTVFNFLILNLTGNIGVAAFGIIANLSLVVTSVFNGIAQGSQPLISECKGKNNTAQCRQVLFYGIITSLIFFCIMYTAIFICSNQFIAIFNSENSDELQRLALEGIRIYFAGFLFAGINIVVTGYFSAADLPFPAAVCSVSRGIISIILCAFLLSFLFGMTGIWLAFPAAEIITSAAAVICMKSELIKMKR